MKILTQFLIVALFGGCFSGCAPTVYFVDRATVMEEEAGGDWSHFEEELMSKEKKVGSTPLRETENSLKGKRFNQVLNGTFTP